MNDTNYEEHRNILDEMLKKHYKKILDLGSGRTSMSLLLNKYKDSNITGVCYPGDNRKLDKIRNECIGKYSLIEKDICQEKITDTFELVVAHLLFGEATRFGNTLENMANNVFKINAEYILLVDYLEDIDIDYDVLTNIANKNNFIIEDKKIFAKNKEQEFAKFIGKNYIAILFGKKIQ